MDHDLIPPTALAHENQITIQFCSKMDVGKMNPPGDLHPGYVILLVVNARKCFPN